MKKTLYYLATLLLSLPLLALLSIPAMAQAPNMQSQDVGAPPAPQGERHLQKWGERRGGGMMPMGAPMGAWWKNPQVVQEINLTDAQAQKIGETFQSHRLQLIDLHAD